MNPHYKDPVIVFGLVVPIVLVVVTLGSGFISAANWKPPTSPEENITRRSRQWRGSGGCSSVRCSRRRPICIDGWPCSSSQQPLPSTPSSGTSRKTTRPPISSRPPSVRLRWQVGSGVRVSNRRSSFTSPSAAPTGPCKRRFWSLRQECPSFNSTASNFRDRRTRMFSTPLSSIPPGKNNEGDIPHSSSYLRSFGRQ